LSGNPPPVCLTDFEPLARAKMSAMAYEYLIGGAGDEITLRQNRSAFDDLRLLPRVLVDVSKIDTSVNVIGQRMPIPIILAPVGYQKLFHPEGEAATARGGAKAGAILTLSTFSNVSVEDVANGAGGPIWFQLYVQPDRGFTRELIALGYQDARARADEIRAFLSLENARQYRATPREERATPR